MPALVCGSFSDNNLHSRGSFRGWQHIASPEKFLYTHRGGKWATFYSPDARDVQLAFFDRYLRGAACRHRPGSGWKSGKPAISSPASGTRTTGRWNARGGRRCI